MGDAEGAYVWVVDRYVWQTGEQKAASTARSARVGASSDDAPPRAGKRQHLPRPKRDKPAPDGAEEFRISSGPPSRSRNTEVHAMWLALGQEPVTLDVTPAS